MGKLPLALVVLVASAATRTSPPSGRRATRLTQWAVFDPANALGIVLSNARTLVLK